MNEWSRKDYPTPESSPEVKQESPEAPSSVSPPASFNSHSPSSPLESALVGYSNGLQIKSETQPKRTTPCQQCRRIRRACKWIEGDEDCERCGKLGKQCTGPTRRSKSTIELVRPAQQQQLKTIVAAIGPSSPETRWSTIHMSYSLTYHLVETALYYTSEGTRYDGFDFPAFLSRFRSAQGRLDQFDAVDDIFATSQMVIGAHCTSHTGILRSTTPIISFETAANSATGSNSAVLADFGFARRQPLSLILKQLASRIQEHLAVPFETREDAADGLAVCVFASAFLEESLEFAPERLRILRLSIQRGLDYTTMAGAVPLAESQDDVVMESLRELVRAEIRQALLLDQPTAISPLIFHSLFGRSNSPTIPAFPDDIWFIFDVKNTLPNAWNLALHYQSVIVPSLFSVFGHLDYLLAYASTPSIPTLVRYTWCQLDQLALIYEQAYKKIYLDPRFELTQHGIRPIACVTLLLTDATHILTILWISHLLLQRHGLDQDLLEESQSRLFNSLGSLADHLGLLSMHTPDKYRLYVTSIDFVEKIRNCSDSILSSWAQSDPFRRDKMIKGLRFVSYAMPDACRIIQVLEAHAVSTDPRKDPRTARDAQ